MMIAVLLLAAFAMPGQAGSYTPQGRRLLSDNSIEDAAEALNSPAAASEIGTAAGEAFKATGEAVKEAVESAMDGKPAPTMSTAAAPASATNSSVQEVRSNLYLPCAQAVRLELVLCKWHDIIHSKSLCLTHEGDGSALLG